MIYGTNSDLLSDDIMANRYGLLASSPNMYNPYPGNLVPNSPKILVNEPAKDTFISSTTNKPEKNFNEDTFLSALVLGAGALGAVAIGLLGKGKNMDEAANVIAKSTSSEEGFFTRLLNRFRTKSVAQPEATASASTQITPKAATQPSPAQTGAAKNNAKTAAAANSPAVGRTKTTFYPDTQIKQTEIKYGTNGKKLEEIHYDAAGEIEMSSKYKYDASGKRSEKCTTFKDNTQSVENYIDGELSEKAYQSADRKIISIEKYKDKELHSRTTLKSGGSETIIEKYTDGKVSEIISTKPDGSKTIEYYADGKCTRRIAYDKDGQEIQIPAKGRRKKQTSC